MNILLIGEYSRLHNSLKEGLIKIGHRVVIFGFKDGFKDYPVDFAVYKKWDSGILKKIKIGVFRLTGFDISSYLTYRQFVRYKSQLSGFDIVQLINENSLECQPKFECKILEFIFANNAKTFLLSCGDDYANVNYAFAHPEMKSAVQPYLAGKISPADFENVLKYQRPGFKKLHDFIYGNIKGVIASDLDYEPALKNHPKYLGLIPNPINTDWIAFESLVVSDKIHIFQGINARNYYKKGSDYFEEALKIIGDKYAGKVEITVVRSVPYEQYRKLYNESHILLDQAFAIDQGYNALEAMAAGKVVFTGAEPEFVQHYGLSQNVNINAVPDVDRLVADLSHLIQNPDEIRAIGKRARDFIEREHNYTKIAQKYLDTWK
jgi:glycosyltransferase involved in cell wall biosynthesis